ncbi:MAG TPA: hypothetical protein VGJ32_16790 [Solirubrobacteraceae bacterium]|jgi:hypothetical protein
MSDDVTRRPFASWLQDQRGGGLHGELSDALAELVAAVREHDKGGSLTLTVKVAPNGESVMVSDDVKVTPPKPARGASLFFADHQGNLSRRNPAQPELPLREVPADDADVKEVGA